MVLSFTSAVRYLRELMDSSLVLFDDDEWRSRTTAKLLGRWASGVQIIRAATFMQCHRWVGLDNANIVLVRMDAMHRAAPDLIEQIRWYESSHGHRRHPVLMLSEGEERGESTETGPFDGEVQLSWTPAQIAETLAYWIDQSCRVKWIPPSI